MSRCQLYNLPAPKFADGDTEAPSIASFESAVESADFAAAFGVIARSHGLHGTRLRTPAAASPMSCTSTGRTTASRSKELQVKATDTRQLFDQLKHRAFALVEKAATMPSFQQVA